MGKERNDDLEIVPRKVVRPKAEALFQKIELGRTTGKSSKYLKEVMVPALRLQIQRLKRKLSEARSSRKDVKDNHNKIVTQVKNSLWTKKNNKDYGVKERALNQMAREYYYDKMKAQRVHNSNYIDGISAYPIIQQQARIEGVTYKQFGLFIIINHYEWFQLKDTQFFGYSYGFTARQVAKLVDKGLVDKFIGHRNSYVVTLKGQKRFKELFTIYKKRTMALFKEWDKKMAARTEMSGVSMNHKFISSVNLDDE